MVRIDLVWPWRRRCRLVVASVLLASALTFACGSSETTPAAPTPTPTPSPLPTATPDPWSFAAAPSAEVGLRTVTEAELRDSVYYLASEALAGRGSGKGGDLLAAEFVERHFRQYGLRPGHGDSYQQPFDVFGERTANVLGYLPGADPALAGEVIVIGAHLDHLGNTATGTSYYPGADDNASGTAAVIEAAEALSVLRARLPRTVVFAGFSGEELGMVGSHFYVSQPAFPISQTVYMIDLDMIGHLRQGLLYFIGAISGSTVQNDLIQQVVAHYPGVTAQFAAYNGGSDHAPFRAAGIPYFFLHTGITGTYHQVTDTAESLDYAGLSTATKIAIELTWRVANGTRALGARPLEPLLFEGPPLDHGVAPFLKQ